MVVFSIQAGVTPSQMFSGDYISKMMIGILIQAGVTPSQMFSGDYISKMMVGILMQAGVTPSQMLSGDYISKILVVRFLLGCLMQSVKYMYYITTVSLPRLQPW